MLSFRDDFDLLAAVADGPFEEPLWSGFLGKLAAATGADYASLTFRRPGPPPHQVVHLYAGDPWPPPVQRRYEDIFHSEDPLPYHALEEGRVYALHELLRSGDPLHDSYYRELLAPAGMNVMRMVRLAEASGVNAWLTISRRLGDFDSGHEALLSAVAPYLRAALRGFVALERERFNASVAGEAIRRLNFGWFTLDASGRVLDADAEGDRILTHSGVLSRGDASRLLVRPAGPRREIMAAIRMLAADPRSRPRAIVLGRDPWTDMLLVPTRRRSISAKPDPAVIAYVHGDGWSSADRCEHLAEMFNLLPSEARLALALSRGMTISEAASDLGLTVETARSYSKKIYAKTGARGQPDLIRFILTSVLAIA